MTFNVIGKRKTQLNISFYVLEMPYLQDSTDQNLIKKKKVLRFKSIYKTHTNKIMSPTDCFAVRLCRKLAVNPIQIENLVQIDSIWSCTFKIDSILNQFYCYPSEEPIGNKMCRWHYFIYWCFTGKNFKSARTKHHWALYLIRHKTFFVIYSLIV